MSEVQRVQVEAPADPKGRRLVFVWAVSTGILFCLSAAWSLATPIGAAQDQPAQLVRAASVARGEIVGSTPSPRSMARLPAAEQLSLAYCALFRGAARCDAPFTVVRVPQSFARLTKPSCYQDPAVPAGCAPPFAGSGRETLAVTYVGRYPPLYYAVVGLPSLVSHTDVAVYLMRLVSGLLSALFLGLTMSLAAVWGRSRLFVLAVAATVTPMVIIFGSVVNPSGLECATAVCVWTGGLVLVLDRASDPPRALVVATAAAAAVMVLTRGLSPLWLAIIALSLAALAPRSVPVLLRQRNVKVALGVVALAGLVAVAFIVLVHSLEMTPGAVSVPRGSSLIQTIELALGRTGAFVEQFVGTIGWAETSPPLVAVVAVVVSASVVLGAGLVTSQRRHATVVIALVVGSLAVPTALMVSQSQAGLVWQARDGFPLYAGVLLTAGAVAGRRTSVAAVGPAGTVPMSGVVPRLALMTAIAVAGAQLADFVWALRRYTVGLGSVINPFASVRGGWSPPMPAVFLVVAVAAVIVGYGWWMTRLVRLQGQWRGPPFMPTAGPLRAGPS